MAKRRTDGRPRENNAAHHYKWRKRSLNIVTSINQIRVRRHRNNQELCANSPAFRHPVMSRCHRYRIRSPIHTIDAHSLPAPRESFSDPAVAQRRNDSLYVSPALAIGINRYSLAQRRQAIIQYRAFAVRIIVKFKSALRDASFNKNSISRTRRAANYRRCRFDFSR